MIPCLICLLSSSGWLMAQTYQMHRIDHGETLSSIARKYKITVPRLMEVNTLGSTIIYAGQELVIPVAGTSAAAGAGAGTNARIATPSPAGTSRGSTVSNLRDLQFDQANRRSVNQSVPAPASRTPSLARQAEDVWVRTNLSLLGDQPLSNRAMLHNRAPMTSETQRTRSGSSSNTTNQRTAGPTDVTAPQGEQVIHRVGRDEDIYDIAERYGVTVEQIQSWNSNRPIYTGQKLAIYRDPTAPILNLDQPSLDDIESQFKGTPATNQGNMCSGSGSDGQRLADPTPVPPRTQVGMFDVFEWPDTKESFYLAHQTLPVGSTVKLAIPNTDGYLTLKVVAYHNRSSKTDFSLSPAAAKVLLAAGAEQEATLILEELPR
jgi:LysM repeat protein